MAPPPRPRLCPPAAPGWFSHLGRRAGGPRLEEWRQGDPRIPALADVASRVCPRGGPREEGLAPTRRTPAPLRFQTRSLLPRAVHVLGAETLRPSTPEKAVRRWSLEVQGETEAQGGIVICPRVTRPPQNGSHACPSKADVPSWWQTELVPPCERAQRPPVAVTESLCPRARGPQRGHRAESGPP